MPDRMLSQRELEEFKRCIENEIRFNAIEIMLDEKSEPSLHDLVLLSLIGLSESRSELLISQGKEIEVLKIKINEMYREMNK